MSGVECLPGNPFAANETVTVGLSGRPVLHLPVCLVIDGDNITLDQVSHRPAAPVQFVPFTDFLGDEIVRELTERLAAVCDLRPAAISVDQHNNIEVPLIAPDVVNDDSVSWAVTDALSVVHEDRAQMYLTYSQRIRQVALTAAQAWRLVQALVSLDYWHSWLQGSYAAAATQARRALRSTKASAPTAAGAPATGAS